MTLANQVALITGGANGIGAAIARHLWSLGASVAVADVQQAALDGYAPAAPGQQIGAWVANATSTADVERLFGEVAARFGPVSILVNNVGGAGPVRCAGIEDVVDESWDLIMALNLGSAMRCVRAAVPEMRKRRYGRIINIGSGLMRGMFSNPGTAAALLPYATAKSGLYGFTRQLAYELAPEGITVNAVLPGLTFPDEDATITRRFRALPEEEQARLIAPIPAGRAGNGADIANAVSFLASPASGYITAELINVSGGYQSS